MKMSHTSSKKEHMYWFLLVVLFSFFLLRFPSLFEPLWYGDEGIYQVIGSSLNQGRLLYTQTWDNKPPLLYILYALLGSDQFTVRFTSILFGMGTVIAFYGLARQAFQSTESGLRNKIVLITTILFAVLFGTPLLEGNIANAENFMLLPIIISGFFLIRAQGHETNKKEYKSLLLFSGLLLSVAFLFKIVAIFDTGAFFLFLYFTAARRKLFEVHALKKTTPFIVGFFVPVCATVLYFFLAGNFLDSIRSVFFQMFGYVGYGNRLYIPQGFLLLKLVLLGSSIIYIFAKRKVLHPVSQFILLWFSFSLFNTFFAQRPYTHYLLVLLPSFLLLVGLVFVKKRYQKHFFILLFLTLIVVLSSFKTYTKTLKYYHNFLSYIANQKDLASYRNFFDGKTEKNYQVAQYVKSRLKEKDKVFLWGNSAQMYTLIGRIPPGRFVVAYHMTASKQTLAETEDVLTKARPKFVIVESVSDFIPIKLVGYSEKIQIQNTIIYERVL